MPEDKHTQRMFSHPGWRSGQFFRFGRLWAGLAAKVRKVRRCCLGRVETTFNIAQDRDTLHRQPGLNIDRRRRHVTFSLWKRVGVDDVAA